jgi:two-component system chemotaxis response regulator CheY
MKILFVDDDPILHGIVNLWLTKNGHVMESANNGGEALERLQTGDYDVLITDVNMPLMNGIELVKETVKLPSQPPLIIVLTFRCDLPQLTDNINSTNVLIFNKPFNPSKLIELINDNSPETSITP